MVKGINWRMLPRLPCSKHSTHSSMNHWTNWVCVPAVLAPNIDEISKKRFARKQKWEGGQNALPPALEGESRRTVREL